MPFPLERMRGVACFLIVGFKFIKIYLPSGVMKGESSAPAVSMGPGTGTGWSQSLECNTGGWVSFWGEYFGAHEGIEEYLSAESRVELVAVVEVELFEPPLPPATEAATAKTRSATTTPARAQRRDVVGATARPG